MVARTSLFDAPLYSKSNFPYFSVYRDGDTVCVQVALSGYTKEGLEAYLEGNRLYITGKATKPKENVTYLYKGITTKDFTWHLDFPVPVVSKGATFIDGVLSVSLAITSPASNVKAVAIT